MLNNFTDRIMFAGTLRVAVAISFPCMTGAQLALCHVITPIYRRFRVNPVPNLC